MKDKFSNIVKLTIIYCLFLLLETYFYEVTLPKLTIQTKCGIGYLIFFLPIISVFVTFLFLIFLYSLIWNNENKSKFLYLLIIAPFSIWLYYYGEILIWIISIFGNEK